MSQSPVVLEIEDLRVVYRLKRRSTIGNGKGRLKVAVESATLHVRAGELVSLVGQSGSGKTTLGLAIMGLRNIAGGHIRIDGQKQTTGRRSRRDLASKAQFLFQNPYDSLDPRWRVGQIVEESLRIQRSPISKGERQNVVLEALRRVSLAPPERFVSRLPNELSGGQRQRVAIAAALIVEPRVLIADEPVSMLDATVRTSILSLLKALCLDGLAVLMITHDLSTAASYSDRIIVMKEGLIVEQGTAEDVCNAPRHPYTRALLEAIPKLPQSPSATVKP